MPSLPVRGFGEDGLLVTAGVGSADTVAAQTVSGAGSQAGLLGRQDGIGAIGILVAASSGFGYGKEQTSIKAKGRQIGLLGAQNGIGSISEVERRNGLVALFDLDPDLYAAMAA